MKKIGRNLSTPEARAFWENVKRTAAEARKRPDWERAGINLNPRNFETYGAEG